MVRGHSGLLGVLEFSPDGKTLATGGSRRVKLWNTASLQEMLTLYVAESPVNYLRFAPNGTSLVVAGMDLKCRFFKAPLFSEIDSEMRGGESTSR